MTMPSSALRFPALWAPDAPGLRSPVRSWAQDVLVVERAHRWASTRLAIAPAVESMVVQSGFVGRHARPDGRLEWAEFLRLCYTRWASDTATPLVSRELVTRIEEADSFEQVAREMWPAWWDSGVLPGDLPPLDREKMGLVARFVERHRHTPAPDREFRSLVTPTDLLRIQAPLALMARRLNASWDDPAARVWLGAWSPDRASHALVPQEGGRPSGAPQSGVPQRGVPQRGVPQGGVPQGGAPQNGARQGGAAQGNFHQGAIDLSRARYVLATTGWPAPTRTEAGLHVWDLWSRSRYPMGNEEGSDDGAPPIADSDPWLVLLADEAPAQARTAMLDFLGRDAVRGATSGWLSPRLSVELARLLRAEEGERLARQWVRSPVQAWREAGLLLLTHVRQQAGTEAGAGARATTPQTKDGQRSSL